jgi:hypothetical protein
MPFVFRVRGSVSRAKRGGRPVVSPESVASVESAARYWIRAICGLILVRVIRGDVK